MTYPQSSFGCFVISSVSANVGATSFFLIVIVNKLLNILELWLGRVPVRLYVRRFTENFDDLEDAPQIDNWDKISYINRPVEIHGEEGKSWLLFTFLCTRL